MLQADVLQATHDAKILQKELNSLTSEKEMLADLLFSFYKEYCGLEYLDDADDVHFAEAYLRINNFWSSEDTSDPKARAIFTEVPF